MSFMAIYPIVAEVFNSEPQTVNLLLVEEKSDVYGALTDQHYHPYDHNVHFTKAM